MEQGQDFESFENFENSKILKILEVLRRGRFIDDDNLKAFV